MPEPKRDELLSTPINQIDLEKVESIGDLMEAFKGSSIQSRALAQCAQIFEDMLTDPDRPTIIMGISGALIAGGMRKVIRDMIDKGVIDVLVSTGAILYQDFYQARGYQHYRGTPLADDGMLHDMKIDRIYDTYVDEEKFEETDRYIGGILSKKLSPGLYSSREILDMLGWEIDDKNSIMATAARLGTPMFSPALNDSSIGIGLTVYYKNTRGKKRVTLDCIKDNHEMLSIIAKSKKTAAIYIGGGTPKNWVNDAVVMANYTFDREIDGHTYAIQLTMDPPHWGGLSGSTLSEAQSWGKVNMKATKAMAYVEATIGLPLIAGYIFQKGLWKDRSRLRFDWGDDELRSLAVKK